MSIVSFDVRKLHPQIWSLQSCHCIQNDSLFLSYINFKNDLSNDNWKEMDYKSVFNSFLLMIDSLLTALNNFFNKGFLLNWRMLRTCNLGSQLALARFFPQCLIASSLGTSEVDEFNFDLSQLIDCFRYTNHIISFKTSLF